MGLFSRYVSVGLSLNVVAFLLYVAFLRISDLEPLASLVMTQLIVAPIAYFLNRQKVFNSSNESRREMSRFVLIYGAAFASNIFILSIATNVNPNNPIGNQAVSVIITSLMGFAFHRSWTFRQRG